MLLHFPLSFQRYMVHLCPFHYLSNGIWYTCVHFITFPTVYGTPVSISLPFQRYMVHLCPFPYLSNGIWYTCVHSITFPTVYGTPVSIPLPFQRYMVHLCPFHYHSNSIWYTCVHSITFPTVYGTPVHSIFKNLDLDFWHVRIMTSAVTWYLLKKEFLINVTWCGGIYSPPPPPPPCNRVSM